MRIHITGNAGSGKTTLAKELGDILNIPVFGLDKIVWKENWTVTPQEERAFREQELIIKHDWIIEGVSSTVRDSADWVVFLDFPQHICLKRGILRSFKYLFSTRPELPNNCPEIKIIHRLIKLIWQFNKYARPSILREISKKNYITICNNNDLYHFIESVRNNKVIIMDTKTLTAVRPI
ncbi:AAA family ATPase [Oceanicoccus sp. KOV_DT_Chl]|uniref:AAA family ATPase n=1 Tax=Oceanicoccus sp. KOV_DT_Chl TaxID=1904639 RepID=UPI000C7A59C2|nr:AAA family ATPase [Oceanicoccus sp. KOV_DT_Chl]